MIKNFFIINFTGKNDSIGLKVDNNFFVKKLQTNIRKNDLLVNSVFGLISEKKLKLIKTFPFWLTLDQEVFQELEFRLLRQKALK